MTQQTWFPYKITDLQQVNGIHGITLHNLQNMCVTHACLFSILLSDNAQDWVCYHSQTNHSWKPTDANIIYFEKTIFAQYVKFQLNTFGNIDPLEITIEPTITNDTTSETEYITDIIQTYKDISTHSTVVFSALFNESDDFLLLYLDNFLFFTPDNTYLIVNLPHNRPIPDATHSLSYRIIIINGTIERKKWGNTLLLGHLENLKYANDHLSFDYFCTTASNNLFVRPFSLTNILYMLHQKSIVPLVTQRSYDHDVNIHIKQENHDGGWMWHHYMLLTELQSHIEQNMNLDKLSVTQIEGLFASSSDWLLVLQQYSTIDQITPYLSDELFVALEEILPTSIFNQHGSSYYLHTCYMLWKHCQRTITTSEIISIGSNLPQHISMIKWFPRNTNAAATLAVSTQWGRMLLGIEKNPELSLMETFLINQEFSEASKLIINNHPITHYWPDINTNNSSTILYWGSNFLYTQGQYISISSFNSTPEKNIEFPAHFIFNNIENFIDLNCYLTKETNKNYLHYSCWAKDQNNNFINLNTPVIEGFLYLSTYEIRKSIKISIQKNDIPDYNTYQHLYETFFAYDNNHLNEHYAHNYCPLTPHLINDTQEIRELYFNNCMWIGIPIISNRTVKISISLI